VVGTYNAWLVVLSVVVAVVASYVALDLASQVTAARNRLGAWLWILGGSATIGSGIWAMHFVGMLALSLPIPVSYDVTITAVSLLLPIVVSGLGLHIAARTALSPGRLAIGGIFVGAGILAMHYSGMAAMKMQPPIAYEPGLVGMSMLIAVSGSLVSIWSSFALRMETFSSALVKKAGSAVATGAAISGMHYAGMAAARFAPGSVCTTTEQNIDNVLLATIVAALALTFLAMTLVVSALHAYRAERSSSEAAALQRANVDLDRARRELEERVAERTAELSHLNRRLLELQETERRELARELHDRVGQNLTALAINLDILRTQQPAQDLDERRARVEDSIALVEATADAIENVMAELRPPMLDDHGLLAALQWYARQFSQRTGIEVEVHGKERSRRLAQELEITLFRIAQEALNNVAKHAHAAGVEIELRRAGGDTILSVSDDGMGFDVSALPGAGRGMATMRERTLSVNGRFELRSALGEGTTISVLIPSQT
jgi:NO-binding membrane sensor protein with MHYT domain/two-component sensor histidine kinase